MRVEQGGSLSSGNCVHLLTALFHKLYLCCFVRYKQQTIIITVKNINTLLFTTAKESAIYTEETECLYTYEKYSCFSSAFRQVDRCVPGSKL